MRITRKEIKTIFTCSVLILLASVFVVCSSDKDDEPDYPLDCNATLTLIFTIPKTETALSDDRLDYENYINIAAGHYKIYFFSYKESDTNGGTLLAEFTTKTIEAVENSNYTQYIVTGDVPMSLMEDAIASDGSYSFKVVMLANWGSYPEVTEGTTTIDDLCEGTNTTFSAKTDFTLSPSNLIPFYGVQEYSGVTLTMNEETKLGTEISLLRAMAKVEVVFDDGMEIADVSIQNYNAEGYCAPKGVYLSTNYNDYALHLVGGENDTESKSQSFLKVDNYTWRAYLPEYNNMGDDFAYISVKINSDDYDYKIYFAEYTDNDTENSESERFDIMRNYFYSFTVPGIAPTALSRSAQASPLKVKVDKIELK